MQSHATPREKLAHFFLCFNQKRVVFLSQHRYVEKNTHKKNIVLLLSTALKEQDTRKVYLILNKIRDIRGLVINSIV